MSSVQIPPAQKQAGQYVNAADKRNNVAPLPPVVNNERKQAAGDSLRVFLETYFPEVFELEWSEDHIRIIDEIEKRILFGGLKAIAMPRGSGKTSIMTRAALWAILFGHRRFVCIVGANEASAVGLLNTIKNEILFNDLLAADFGLELACLRKLAGEPRRATNQHFNHAPTGVQYSTRKIGFGTVPGSPCAGAIISTAGITGQIRGQQDSTIDGKTIRPDCVLVDDPQTTGSAASNAQCDKRHGIMMGDILGLAGPGVQIAGFCSCTVIYQDDLADRLLNRELSKDWGGDKIAMIKRWPKWIDGWDQWDSLRREDFETGGDKATQFVRDNFEKLHEEAKVYWEARQSSDDLSALHHAMKLYYRDQGVFAAEFQNSPSSKSERAPFELDRNAIARRTVGMPRGRAPSETTNITAFIDVQRELLFYMVVAWTQQGRAFIIDYGSAPDQKRHHFTKRSVRFSLKDHYGENLEAAIRGGLEWLTKAILDNDYVKEDGSVMQVDRLAIDARWGESTEIIRRFVRESHLRSRMHPSMGMFIGANTRPWQKLKKDKKDKESTHAKLQAPKEKGQREMLYDANYWKSFAADRLTVGKENPKAILLFDAEPHIHRMISEHFSSETPIRAIGRDDNEVVEWRLPSGSSADNDFWDCLVGNCALASLIGVKTHEGRIRPGGLNKSTIEKIVQKQKNRGWKRG